MSQGGRRDLVERLLVALALKYCLVPELLPVLLAEFELDHGLDPAKLRGVVDGLPDAALRSACRAALAIETKRPCNDGVVFTFGSLVSRAPSMRELFALLAKCASSDITMLIRGETGTGKTAIARAVHAMSLRSNGPFCTIDCGALPPALVEGEMFGVASRAVTGVDAREGLFQAACGGTAFLDEVGELPLDVQTRFLRVLQERRVRPVGGVHEAPVDVRLLAATHQDLEKLIAERKFREDLFARLAVVTVELPPLRERREDIPVLAEAFLRKNGVVLCFEAAFTQAGRERLLAHDWPRNVRELEHAVERAVVLGGEPPFGEEALRLKPNTRPSSLVLAAVFATSPNPDDEVSVLRAALSSRKPGPDGSLSPEEKIAAWLKHRARQSCAQIAQELRTSKATAYRAIAECRRALRHG